MSELPTTNTTAVVAGAITAQPLSCSGAGANQAWYVRCSNLREHPARSLSGVNGFLNTSWPMLSAVTSRGRGGAQGPSASAVCADASHVLVIRLIILSFAKA